MIFFCLDTHYFRLSRCDGTDVQGTITSLLQLILALKTDSQGIILLQLTLFTSTIVLKTESKCIVILKFDKLFHIKKKDYVITKFLTGVS